jgi:hypothetical protein
VGDADLADQVTVRRARAEDLAGESPEFDVVIARALARLPMLLELLLPLCRAGKRDRQPRQPGSTADVAHPRSARDQGRGYGTGEQVSRPQAIKLARADQPMLDTHSRQECGVALGRGRTGSEHGSKGTHLTRGQVSRGDGGSIRRKGLSQ